MKRVYISISTELKVFALLACILLSSGCSLAPDYVRPELDMPGAFSAANAPERDLAGYADVNRAWWQHFNSAALPRLQEAALANNHNFRADRWVLAQTFSRTRAARSVLLPAINLSGSASRRGSANAGGYSVSDVVGGTLQASYEVDIWGKNRDSVGAQEYRAEAGMNVWRGAGLSLESEVALTYFSYLAAHENLSVYDSMLRNAKEVLAYQEKRETQGAEAPLNVARQRSSVQNMEAGRINYTVRVTEARNNLCLLLGVTALPEEIASCMEKETLMAIAPVVINEGIPSDLLVRRPDIAEMEARLMAANADIGVARAAFLPGISLTASSGWQSGSLSSLINPANALYSLAGSLVAPIFNNGKNIAQHDEALAARNELVERYRQITLRAFWEVSTALSANELLEQQEKHRAAASAQAAEAYRIARLRYTEGAEDFLAVLNAQDSVLSADNSMIQTHLERLNTVVSLFKALGGGWDGEGDMDAMRREFATIPGATL